MNTWTTLLAIAGLAVITLVTRGFFVLPERELPIPTWLRQGLRYAPLAALSAVIAPELLMTDGVLTASWRDARLFGAAAGAAWFFWRRGILGTILTGTGVMLALKLLLGW